VKTAVRGWPIILFQLTYVVRRRAMTNRSRLITLTRDIISDDLELPIRSYHSLPVIIVSAGRTGFA